MYLGFVFIKGGAVTDAGTTTFERRVQSLHFPREGPTTPHGVRESMRRQKEQRQDDPDRAFILGEGMGKAGQTSLNRLKIDLFE